MNSAKVIQRLFWGVDFKILKLCTDEMVRFIKYEITILVLTSISIFAFLNFAHKERIGNANLLTAIVGVFVFFIYKLYLSNLHISITGKNNVFVQWLISTFLALGSAYCLITSVFNVPVNYYMATSDIFLSVIITILSCLIFYMPVRFISNKGCLYAKLLKKNLEEEDKLAEQTLAGTFQYEQQRRKEQLALNKQVEQFYTTKIAQEIANARLRIAKEVLAQWESEQQQKIRGNIDKYIS